MADPNVNTAPESEQRRTGSIQSGHSNSSTLSPKNSIISKAWSHMLEPIRPSEFAELELLILTFCTGIQDAISFPDYHCFASNQTGNTVFLMLAALLPHLNGEMFILANIASALGFFLLGAYITGQVGHFIGPRRRIWLFSCNFIQSCLVFGAAGMQYVHGAGLRGGDAVIVVGLLAFASGSQVVQSRAFKMTEISTAMATAAWVDLVIDPNLLKMDNRPRTRRALFLGTLIVGSLAGAGIYRAAGSWVAILVSAAGKMVVTGMYLFNSAEKPKKTEGQDAC
ncbi:uncharacterized protein F4822DRAFT_231971 [Hypoxylon trugodes]|uniref:uncharacterized protein n=1 Tax=Hypoxylon trugodes TaxID=326681 RepID=UPI0021A0CD35|nr:uncharacterized protein F4822DRAFT_231971 [Hypoxylon trugodes]KAI1390301.1 hypothetical protein F4822DRAFT_231971 [Hypoxylon trugodes]